jgi:hypothetical protein
VDEVSLVALSKESCPPWRVELNTGKLVAKWSDKDVLGFLQQIGVIPPFGHAAK